MPLPVAGCVEVWLETAGSRLSLVYLAKPEAVGIEQLHMYSSRDTGLIVGYSDCRFDKKSDKRFI